MSLKNKLNEEVWTKKEYYQIAKKGLDESSHEGMRILKELASQANTILDLGCGEGSRLNELSDSSSLVGVDISQTAIELAKKNYPKINFIKADLEKIPIKDSSFDLVYAAFVLEHLTNPETVLHEAIRLVKNNGKIVLIAPNYGAPNRCSPPFKGNRVIKLFFGLLEDFNFFSISKKDLNWATVEPIATKDQYEVDWDTTVEPYANTLKLFLKAHGIKIEYLSTCWSEEASDAKIHQRLFALLAALGIYPFTMWGPHLIIVGKKI